METKLEKKTKFEIGKGKRKKNGKDGWIDDEEDDPSEEGQEIKTEGRSIEIQVRLCRYVCAEDSVRYMMMWS